MSEPVECLRCGTPMEAGYVADRAYGQNVQEKWSPGEPRSHWWGLEVPRGAIPVTTLRCPKCGALESFAPPA